MSLKRALRAIWVAVLTAAVASSIALSWKKMAEVPDLATGCDPFGHLNHAREIREARARHETPRLDFRGEQVTELLTFLKQQSEPYTEKDWLYLPSPHAFMYRPASDRVINQYPPGTAQLLALFPRQGIAGLIQATLIGAGALFAAALALYFRRRNLVALTLAAILCDQIAYTIRELGLGNPSAYASILPVVFGASLLAARRGLAPAPQAGLASRPASAALTILDSSLTLAGGALLGFAVFIRPPSLLLIPAFFVISGRRDRALLALSVLVAGILPLALYQAEYAGAWFRSTYGEMDSSLPVLRTIPGYLKFYLKHADEGGRFFTHTGVAALLFAGLLRARLSPWKWVWLPSLFFFITHSIPTPYYLSPANLALTATLAAVATFASGTVRERPRRIALLLGLIWAANSLVPRSIAAVRELQAGPKPIATAADEDRFARARIPAELLARHAWVWSDLYSGSFLHYGGKTAFRIGFWVKPDVRERVSRWTQSRGEPQFLVLDGENTREVFDDWKKRGATLTSRGRVFGEEYFEVAWPAKR